MNNEAMAKFILELRKSHNMTQKQLAEKLNITDKAVSKWERGLSYPDISLLSPLAEIFGVTTNELLNGERSNTSVHEVVREAEVVVEKALHYADKSTRSKFRNIRTIGKNIISVMFLLGMIVCVICDFAITGTLTWSLYPISSIIFAWLIIMPLFQYERRGIRVSLAVLSIIIIPFLFVLDKIIGSAELLMPIGIRVSAIAIVYLWCIYILFSLMKTRRWMASAIVVLSAIPVTFMINYVVSQFVEQPSINIWDFLSYGILVVIAIILIWIGNFSNNKNRNVAKVYK
ncbi:helix-turn-helix domain-containing protein [Bacillus massiliigorillae]|uniref:helix-turn-helix domain-containing protein n=1 Tax=Bacillus massiliigorillae TaxID=1243664 RepID=UPI00039A4D7C|nr:helix-turn-helix domain-containing protein [Bacillus massiliigorillae]